MPPLTDSMGLQTHPVHCASQNISQGKVACSRKLLCGLFFELFILEMNRNGASHLAFTSSLPTQIQSGGFVPTEDPTGDFKVDFVVDLFNYCEGFARYGATEV